jgi:hypothetical protein
MRGLSLTEDGFVAGASVDDFGIHNIDPPPKPGMAVRPAEANAGVGSPVTPPPHTGPVLPPSAPQ